jgi:two-component sensor histidine kinase
LISNLLSHIKKAVSIPSSNYDNHYDFARFALTWRLTQILLAFLPPLAITLFSLGEMAAYPTLIGIVLCLVQVYVLLKTKNFFVTAVFYCVFGISLCVLTLLFSPNSFHFVDLSWMFIIILYTYFSLGKIWGNSALFVSVLGTTYYILFLLSDNIKNVGILNTDNVIALTINFILCNVIIGYLIFQFLKLNQYAEEKYVSLTDTLKIKNKEKTVLLQEVHHRVKNNLQVIISLLRIQSRDITDEKYLNMHMNSINRVLSMASIHEKVYQSEDLSKINLKSYTSELINDLIASYSIDKSISFTVESDVEKLNMQSLVPFALILNELISNSIKHGFSTVDKGVITIVICSIEDRITMEYSDNGTWIDNGKETSIGVILIEALTEQLNGTLIRTIDSGTHYVFNFEEKNESKNQS